MTAAVSHCITKNSKTPTETAVVIPDLLLFHNYGLYSSQGLVNNERPIIIISNETFHPISISVDMKLGSISPYIRITDDFILAETPQPVLPSENGGSDDSSYSTLTSAGSTACAPIQCNNPMTGYGTFPNDSPTIFSSEPISPDPPPEYTHIGHI